MTVEANMKNSRHSGQWGGWTNFGGMLKRMLWEEGRGRGKGLR
jgi:hypothetical protein